MNRASWVCGAGAASLAAANARAAIAQPVRSLTMAVLGPSAASWPFFICEELGFYQRYGISIDNVTVTSTAACAQLLIAKGCDVTDISTTQVIEAVIGGADIKMYTNTISTPPYALVAQKDCKKASDLRGKSIVVGGINDATRIFAERILAAGGVHPDEYTETYAGATTDRYAALRSGSVAGAILFPPWNFRATDDGYTVIGTVPGAMPPFPYTGLSARGDFAQAHPDLLLAMLASYVRAIRWLYDPANRPHAIAILSGRTKTAPSDAGRTYDELITKYHSFQRDARNTSKAVDVVLGMLTDLAMIKPPLPPPGLFFDDRFIDRAGVQIAREGGA